MPSPLLPLERFDPIFTPLIGQRVAYVQGLCGNVGDGLIEAATFQMFDRHRIQYQVVNREKSWNGELKGDFDHLVLFGGGNMGYPCSGEIRVAAQKAIDSRGLPTTLLPQSWTVPTPAPYDRVFVREPYSHKLHPTAELVPDLGLSLVWNSPVPVPIKKLGIWLRADNEVNPSIRAGLPANRSADPAGHLGRRDFAGYVRRAAQQETIITDRLHFAICGLICDRQVILLPNNYHKNRGMYEAWLKDLGCEWAADVEEAMDHAGSRSGRRELSPAKEHP